MIIFYNKKTGEVVGSIDGRIHTEGQLNMWMGDPKETDRIVVQWIKGKDEQFYPDCTQPEIFREFDEGTSAIYKFKVNIKTKKMYLP